MSYTVNGIVENTHTGMICGYFGPQTDPPGWIIANVNGRTDSTIYDKLYDMGIGTRTNGNYYPPNLNAAFLRGSGSQTLTISSTEFTYTGPAINSFADSKFRSHKHNATQAKHTHFVREYDGTPLRFDSAISHGAWQQNGEYTHRGLDNTSGEIDVINLYSLVIDSVQPDIEVLNTVVNAPSNDNESRPYNIGTSWIIKL